MRNEPLSSIGFGMLRIDPENASHQASLDMALGRKLDLFDLGEFTEESRFREKAKFLFDALAKSSLPTARILVRGELGTAAKLLETVEDLLSKRLVNTELKWTYLVADPEFALPALGGESHRLYAKLAQELDLLEGLSKNGQIDSYGVGSTGFTLPLEHPEALSLAPLLFGDDLETSVRLPRRSGFQWVEFPLNLAEPGAVFEANQLDGANRATLLQIAKKFGVQTIARRPFDALTENGLRRLVNYPDHHRLDLFEAVRRSLEVALAIEAENVESIPKGWAHRLRDQLKHVSDPEHWKEIVRRRINPELASLQETANPPPSRYFDAMDALLLSVRLWCEKNAAERNERMRSALVQAVPPLAGKRQTEDRDLARVALQIYRSIPGLSHILVGLRSPQYFRALDATTPLSVDEIRTAFEIAQKELHESASSA